MAKGSTYPVMSTVFRASTAFDMAKDVFGDIKEFALSPSTKRPACCISLSGNLNECRQYCQAYRLAVSRQHHRGQLLKNGRNVVTTRPDLLYTKSLRRGCYLHIGSAHPCPNPIRHLPVFRLRCHGQR